MGGWSRFFTVAGCLALGVAFRAIGAPYTGPRLHGDIPDRGVKVDNWGIRRRWVEHETGGYWDYCDFPLQNADAQMVADWPMPKKLSE